MRAGPAGFVLLALGRGRLRRRRAEGDARFLGRRARRGGASRGARILGCANHGGDATRRVLLAGSPWPGRRPPVSLGRRPRAHLQGRASRYASTQRAGRVSNELIDAISSRTSLGCLGRFRLGKFPPLEREKNRVQSGRCTCTSRPSFLNRDFGCHPGISFRFHRRLERSFDGRRLASQLGGAALRRLIINAHASDRDGGQESSEALEGAHGGVDCRP